MHDWALHAKTTRKRVTVVESYRCRNCGAVVSHFNGVAVSERSRPPTPGALVWVEPGTAGTDIVVCAVSKMTRHRPERWLTCEEFAVRQVHAL